VLGELRITTVQDLRGPVEGMSGGQRQALAIGRAATWGKGVVILDEPAAALGIAETEQVLRLITDLKENGAAILLVSHNLDHVFQVADRVLVLHQGRTVAEVPINDISPSRLAGVITTGGV
jgi:ABC-type sugar transport system ATPase subunit